MAEVCLLYEQTYAIHLLCIEHTKISMSDTAAMSACTQGSQMMSTCCTHACGSLMHQASTCGLSCVHGRGQEFVRTMVTQQVQLDMYQIVDTSENSKDACRVSGS